MSHPQPAPYWRTIFEDNTGGLSEMRIGLAIWIVWVIVMTTHAVIKKGEWVDIPPNVQLITITFLSAKCVQRFGEKDDSDAPAPVVAAPAPIAPPVV